MIRKRGPWKSIDDVEFATLEWLDWFNHRRLLSSTGDIPPAEFEERYWTEKERESAAGLKQLSPSTEPGAIHWASAHLSGIRCQFEPVSRICPLQP